MRNVLVWAITASAGLVIAFAQVTFTEFPGPIGCCLGR